MFILNFNNNKAEISSNHHYEEILWGITTNWTDFNGANLNNISINADDGLIYFRPN